MTDEHAPLHESTAPVPPSRDEGRTAPTAPRPLAGFGTMFRWGLRLSWRRRRIVLSLVLAGIAGLVIGMQADDREVFEDGTHALWRLIDGDVLGLALPVLALLMVAHGWTRELRERTLVFHLVRPIKRSTLFLARFASGLVPALVAATVLLAGVALTAGASVGLLAYLKLALVVAVSMVTLGAVYYMLSAVFRRGVVAGLVYTFVIEGMLGNMPGTIQRLAINYHARGLFHGVCDENFAAVSSAVARDAAAGEYRPQFSEFTSSLFEATAFPEAGTELLIMVSVATASLLLGIRAVRRRDFALKD